MVEMFFKISVVKLLHMKKDDGDEDFFLLERHELLVFWLIKSLIMY